MHIYVKHSLIHIFLCKYTVPIRGDVCSSMVVSVISSGVNIIDLSHIHTNIHVNVLVGKIWEYFYI